MKAFMKEFKEFISKGNVMDLAVGVIIGGAFQAIVGSLVNDIIMPLLGIITGGLDFSHLAITVGEAQILYGSFISAIINFLLMALVLFLVIKALNKAKSLTAKPEEPKAPTTKKCPYCQSDIPRCGYALPALHQRTEIINLFNEANTLQSSCSVFCYPFMSFYSFPSSALRFSRCLQEETRISTAGKAVLPESAACR